MIWVWVIVGIAVVIVLAALVLRRRRPADGVASFQRQIDALSPEARRPTVQRVEDAAKRDDPVDTDEDDTHGA